MRKYLFIFVGLIVGLSIFVAIPQVFAEDYGLGATAGAAGLKNSDSVPTVAGNIIGTLLSMISVVFFVLVLYGGIIYMTARGNSEQTQKAVNTIIGATIGIVIVMGAYALTNFVFKLGSTTSGSGSTTQTTPEAWCLTAEKQCVQGSGGPCSGTVWSTENACNAAKTAP